MNEILTVPGFPYAGPHIHILPLGQCPPRAATLVCREKHLMSAGKTIIKSCNLYGNLPKITTRISNKRRLQFAGHCKRSEGKIISAVTWRPTQGRRSAGPQNFCGPASSRHRLHHPCRTKDCGKPSLESVRRR